MCLRRNKTPESESNGDLKKVNRRLSSLEDRVDLLEKRKQVIRREFDAPSS
jgi:hypothetical protein